MVSDWPQCPSQKSLFGLGQICALNKRKHPSEKWPCPKKNTKFKGCMYGTRACCINQISRGGSEIFTWGGGGADKIIMGVLWPGASSRVLNALSLFVCFFGGGGRMPVAPHLDLPLISIIVTLPSIVLVSWNLSLVVMQTCHGSYWWEQKLLLINRFYATRPQIYTHKSAEL